MKSAMAVEDREKQHRGRSLCVFSLALVLCVLTFVSSGCSWQHPGETVAEVNQRHDRKVRLDNQMLLSDLDRALLLDRPSRLTDKRLP